MGCGGAVRWVLPVPRRGSGMHHCAGRPERVVNPGGLTAFALATALHAGFQVTVTAIVYPALVEVDDERWPLAHDRHSRRISVVVAVVYGALVLTGAWLVVAGPTTAGWGALLASAAALVVTAVLAAPLHGRLGREPATPALRHRLLVVDRVRCAAAVLGASLAAVAVLA